MRSKPTQHEVTEPEHLQILRAAVQLRINRTSARAVSREVGVSPGHALQLCARPCPSFTGRPWGAWRRGTREGARFRCGTVPPWRAGERALGRCGRADQGVARDLVHTSVAPPRRSEEQRLMTAR